MKQKLPKPLTSGRVCCICQKKTTIAVEAAWLNGKGVSVFCAPCWIGES